jgi:hypothetical protein
LESHIKKTNLESVKSIFVNILLFSSILLNNSFFSLILQFVIFVICILLTSNYTMSIGKLLFTISILISITFNVFNIEFKELIRVIQITIAFLFLPLKIDRSYINKKLLGLIMIFIAFMTISNILGLSFENTFKTRFYPIETNPWATEDNFSAPTMSILFNRYATFFYNPNLLGQTTLLILVIYLIIIHDKKKDIFDFIIFFAGIICLIVSGGRTSFLIFAIIVFLTIIWKMKLLYRLLFFTTVAPFILYKLSESRLLQIISSDESMDSVGVKFSILNTYIKSLKFNPASFFQFLFGTMKSDIQFDNDLGSIFYFTGFFSLLYFFYYIFREFWKTKFSYKPYYAFALISISATIIFNFKFLILTIIILSILRNQTKPISFQE